MDGFAKITVVIPTRERCDTLYWALRTVLRQDYPNFEVLVSDNASADGTEQVVRDAADPRVRYVNTGRRVGMALNYEFALSHVHDGWVTILGDDDALLPGALAYANGVIQESGCQLMMSRLCQYYWPGLRTPDAPPVLSVPLTDGYEVRASEPWIRDVMEGRAYHGELPMLYCGGFASVELIARARDEKGRFYRSLFPDVYSGIVLGWLAGRYAALDRAISVAGASPHSTGFSQFADTGRESIARFYAEENIPVHPLLDEGRVASLPLAYYECYLQGVPVHGDFLRLNLRDQVVLAIQDARGDEEEDEYLRRVARRNGLDFDALAAQAAADAGGEERRRVRHEATVRAMRLARGAYGARNVLEAACVASAIYGEHAESAAGVGSAAG
jgi:glycosyltransferase involved in cell wall biosynthesis